MKVIIKLVTVTNKIAHCNFTNNLMLTVNNKLVVPKPAYVNLK